MQMLPKTITMRSEYPTSVQVHANYSTSNENCYCTLLQCKQNIEVNSSPLKLLLTEELNELYW